MSTTLAAAKVDVYGAISAACTAVGVPAFDHDPTPGNPPVAYVAVTFAGATAEDWLISLRVYSSPLNDPATGESMAVAAIDAIETSLGSDAPRTNWTPLLFDPALVLLISDCVVSVPREDF